MPSFSKSSLEKLETCDGRIQRLFNEVIKYTDCTVVCGHRGEAEQEAAFNAGFSKVHFPKSKHNKTPSLAADVVPYPIDWHDVERFKEFAKIVFECAKRLELEGLTWGGGWRDFPDYPHWEVKA